MICFRCQRRLPTSSFWKDNKKKSGYRSTCKECLKTNQIDREIIAQNKSMKNDDFFGSIPKGLLIPAKNPPKICKECKKRKIANRFKEGSDVCLVCKPEPKQDNILRQLIEKFDTFTTLSIEKSGRVILFPHKPKEKKIITSIDDINNIL